MECRRCEPTNAVCDPVHDTGDMAAWRRCTDANQVCEEQAYTCSQGSQVGDNGTVSSARLRCAGSASCCAEVCSGDLSEPQRSAGRWDYYDVILAGLGRTPATSHAGLAAGVLVQLLFGPTHWQGTAVPARLGPFVSAVYDKRRGNGGQVSAGVTALVGGKQLEHHLATAFLVSLGGLFDRPPDAPNHFGATARVSWGLTSTGRQRWKAISMFFFLEGHWIAGKGAAPAREEVLLGFHGDPLALFFLLVPNVDD